MKARRVFISTVAVVISIIAIAIITAPGDQPNEVAPLLDIDEYDTGPAPEASADNKYLTFQIFTDSNPLLWFAPKIGQAGNVEYTAASKEEISNQVRNIVKTIGVTGSSEHKLGFTMGPVAIDYTDEELRRLIQDGFTVAQENDVAVGFHLDDSMFWYRRVDLWSNVENIEWLDWNRTPNTGRRLDWGGPPEKLAPQMCYNSAEIREQIGRIAKGVIGAEIAKGIDWLRTLGKEELFAGVIVGWETQLAKDFDTDTPLGYCALTNKDFSADNPPADIDLEREKIVAEFIELWAKNIADSGIDPDKIYSHTAFQSRKEYEEILAQDTSRQLSFSEMNNFAPPGVSFGKFHNPGFSTYPAPGLYRDLYDELLKNTKTNWASSEGTNLRIGMRSGEDTMETYLARHFNHGATLVNVFAWGVGDEKDPFRMATENDEALTAYRKFLRGEALSETSIPSDYGLPAKVKKIQKVLPQWLRSGGDQKRVEALFKKMMTLIEENKPWDAEPVADEILELLR